PYRRMASAGPPLPTPVWLNECLQLPRGTRPPWRCEANSGECQVANPFGGDASYVLWPARARRRAVDTWVDPAYLVRRGGGFFGPRRFRLNTSRLTLLAYSLSFAAKPAADID